MRLVLGACHTTGDAFISTESYCLRLLWKDKWQSKEIVR